MKGNKTITLLKTQIDKMYLQVVTLKAENKNTISNVSKEVTTAIKADEETSFKGKSFIEESSDYKMY